MEHVWPGDWAVTYFGSTDERFGASETVIDITTGKIIVPGTEILFRGDYSTDGQDLLISWAGDTVRIADYFTTPFPADLQADNGAILRGGDVARLAGASLDAQLALLHDDASTQTDAIPASLNTDPIGQVDALDGSASVTRADGSTVTLSIGDLIYQNDLVETETSSSVSLVFVDGSVFTLSQNSRMIMDELAYSPSGGDNSGVFNLIQGGFVFVAGQLARTGDMDVNTPTSTIGIRGTTVEVQIVVNDGITEVIVSLLPDWPAGELGQVDLFDVNNDFIASLIDTETSWVISPLDGETRPISRVEATQLESNALLTQNYDVTERAEIRVNSGGDYVEFDNIPSNGPGVQQPQAPDGAPAPQDAAPQDDQGPNDDGSGGTGDQDDAALETGDGTQVAQSDAALEGITNLFIDPALGGTDTGQEFASLLEDPGLGNTSLVNPFNTNSTSGTNTDGFGNNVPLLDGVQAVSAQPIVADLVTDVDEDQSLQINVLQDAMDTRGGTLQLVSISSPNNGTATVSETGAVEYTPALNFSGTDSFTFTVENELGNQASATVTVQVAAINDAPNVSDDTALTAQETSVAINVLGNDQDPDNVLSDLTIAVQSAPENGTTEVVGAQVLYTPNPGFQGTDTFTYSLSDGSDQSPSVATVSILVNDPPRATDDIVQVDEDGSVAISVGGNDVDSENDGFTLTNVSSTENGTTFLQEGVVTYTPNPNFSGADTFTYTVTDGFGRSSSATVTITINSVNDAPVALPDSAITQERAPITIDVLSNDSDIDGDILSIGAIAVAPSLGSVVIEEDGRLTYTPNTNQGGTDSFSYTVLDGNGGSQTASVTIQIDSINTDPIAVDDAGFTSPFNAPVQIEAAQLLANDDDGDPDLAQTLTLTGVGNASRGTVTLDGDLITFTPTSGASGPARFDYTVSDGAGGEATGTVRLDIIENTAPVGGDDAGLTTAEDTILVIDALANDVDANGDPLQISTVSAPSHGQASVTEDGQILYTPNVNFNGTDSFTYTVADGFGGTDTASVTLNITPVSDPVTINPISTDSRLDVEEQFEGFVVAGTAEPNGTVTLTLAGTTVSTATDAAGTFTFSMQSSDLPDAETANITITSTDAAGNASGSASTIVSLERPDFVTDVSVAGSVTNFDETGVSFDLDISDMPFEALFQSTETGTQLRTPTTSGTEIRFTTASGTSFAFSGENLDYSAGTGVVTGFQIGTPTDPDFYTSTGLRIALGEVQQVLEFSVVDGVLDQAPLQDLLDPYRVNFSGSEQQDFITDTNFLTQNDTLRGNGGDDQLDGGVGDDQILGGTGNDFLFDIQGNNTLDGGDGEDTVSYARLGEAVLVDLNAGTATKADGNTDRISNTEVLWGSQFADAIQLADDATFNSVAGLGGDDTLIGGTGLFDFVAYDTDSQFSENTSGVIVDLLQGTATDLFGDTDTLQNFEGVIGSEFSDVLTGRSTDTTFIAGTGDDTVITGAGNDSVQLGQGADALHFSQGTDVVTDFDFSQGDTLVYSGLALQNFDNLITVDFGTGDTAGTAIQFTDESGTLHSLNLEGVARADVNRALSFPEFSGTSGDDEIGVATATGDAISLIASAGDDTYRFANNGERAYQQLLYDGQSFDGIIANINVNDASSTITKGDQGTDTLTDVQQVARFAFGMAGSTSDDTFNLTLHDSELSWIGTYGYGGEDIVNINGGRGLVRMSLDNTDTNTFADLTTGIIRAENGTSITINELGDMSRITYSLRTFGGDDTVAGSERDDLFVLGAGNDSVDGRGGYDIVQYDRPEIRGGIDVNLQTGQGIGSWSDQSFVHTLSNIEEIQGSSSSDVLTAADTGSSLFGRDGNDTLIGGAGVDSLVGGGANDVIIGGGGADFIDAGDGNDFIDASTGTAASQGTGDFIQPGTGRDTILGHEELFQSGGGIDISYANITSDTEGVVITLAQNGTGTANSNINGVVRDTFTFARSVEGTQASDSFVVSAAEEQVLRGHEGDDVFQRTDFAQGHTDGGDGRDSLILSQSGSFDFAAIDTTEFYSDIEEINLENGQRNDVTLSLENVIDFSSTADPLLDAAFGTDAAESLTILGDDTDTVFLRDSEFQQNGTVVDDAGRNLDVYQYVSGAGILAMVAVDQDIEVFVGPAA
ncbi:MAG: Ig-like domain-containing protein [Paracoccaceae bacterium]